jgi:hypothetical protein
LRGWGGEGEGRGAVREGWGQGGEMTQVLYAHMNNKKILKKSFEHAASIKYIILMVSTYC